MGTARRNDRPSILQICERLVAQAVKRALEAGAQPVTLTGVLLTAAARTAAFAGLDRDTFLQRASDFHDRAMEETRLSGMGQNGSTGGAQHWN